MHFTLEEARALLPRVEPLMRTIVEQRQTVVHKQRELAALASRVSSNGHNVAESLAAKREEIQELLDRLNAGIGELHQLGCLVKDLDMGLVDFPSLRDNKPIYLCWRLGEPNIAFWHSIDAGFSSRRAL